MMPSSLWSIAVSPVSKSMLTLALILPTAGSARQAELSMGQDQNANRPYSLSRSHKGRVLRFEVKPGDRWSGDRKSPDAKERSEVAFPTHYANGQDITISFGMKVVGKKPSLAPWAVLGQIHTTPPNGENRTPPVSQQLKGREFFVLAEHQTEQGQIKKVRLAVDPSFKLNRWYSFRYKARFSPNPDGYLQIWRDGKQVADYHGPLGYQQEGGLYFKVGIYRGASSDPITVMYRDIIAGANSPQTVSSAVTQ